LISVFAHKFNGKFKILNETRVIAEGTFESVKEMLLPSEMIDKWFIIVDYVLCNLKTDAPGYK
jgi:formaldehyde-activating enzyme involved in methanogenesis